MGSGRDQGLVERCQQQVSFGKGHKRSSSSFRIAQLEGALNDANNRLANVVDAQAFNDAQTFGNDQKNRADKAEWDLGEHRNWLNDANNK